MVRTHADTRPDHACVAPRRARHAHAAARSATPPSPLSCRVLHEPRETSTGSCARRWPTRGAADASCARPATYPPSAARALPPPARRAAARAARRTHRHDAADGRPCDAAHDDALRDRDARRAARAGRREELQRRAEEQRDARPAPRTATPGRLPVPAASPPPDPPPATPTRACMHARPGPQSRTFATAPRDDTHRPRIHKP